MNTPFLIHICLKRMLGMKHNKNYKGVFINYCKESGSLKLELGHRMNLC